MKNSYLINILLFVAILFLFTACGPSTAKPVSVDMPQLAAALKFLGKCAVACTIIGALALVGSTLIKDK